MPEQAAPREVPGGVKFLGLLAWLIAIVKVVLGLLGFGLGAVMGVSTAIFLGDAFWGSAGWGTAQFVGALFWAVVAIGLRGLKQWAWLLAVIAAGITALSGITDFLTGGSAMPFLGTLELALGVGVLIYLFRPHVARAFGR
jgi:hypothetical protein